MGKMKVIYNFFFVTGICLFVLISCSSGGSKALKTVPKTESSVPSQKNLLTKPGHNAGSFMICARMMIHGSSIFLVKVLASRRNNQNELRESMLKKIFHFI